MTPPPPPPDALPVWILVPTLVVAWIGGVMLLWPMVQALKNESEAPEPEEYSPRFW